MTSSSILRATFRIQLLSAVSWNIVMGALLHRVPPSPTSRSPTGQVIEAEANAPT